MSVGYPAAGSWHSGQHLARCGLPLVAWVSSWTSYWTFIPSNSAPPLLQHTLQAIQIVGQRFFVCLDWCPNPFPGSLPGYRRWLAQSSYPPITRSLPFLRISITLGFYFAVKCSPIAVIVSGTLFLQPLPDSSCSHSHQVHVHL